MRMRILRHILRLRPRSNPLGFLLADWTQTWPDVRLRTIVSSSPQVNSVEKRNGVRASTTQSPRDHLMDLAPNSSSVRITALRMSSNRALKTR